MKSKILLLSLLLTLSFSFVSFSAFSQDDTAEKIENAELTATDESLSSEIVSDNGFQSDLEDEPTVEETLNTIDEFIAWVKGDAKITGVDDLQVLTATIFGLLASLLLYLTHWIKIWPTWWDDTVTKYIAVGLAIGLPFLLGRTDGLTFTEIMTFVEGMGLWGLVYNLIFKRLKKTKEVKPALKLAK